MAYGIEFFDANNNSLFSIGDTTVFIVGTATVSIANSSSSGTLTITVSGAKVGDVVAPQARVGDVHSLEPTVSAANTVSIPYTKIETASGTSTYPIIVVDRGV